MSMPAHAPHAAITLEEGPGEATRWEITEPVTIVGWGGASTLILSDKHMSKVQCLIIHTGRHLLLRDLHSPKPTHLNGERAFIAVLADGDRISIGNTTLAMHIEDGPTGNSDQNDNPMRLPGAIELQDTVSPEKAVLDKAVTVLGRREDLDIYLDDAAISPAHAVVFHFDGRPMVRDLGSRSGVDVNGQSEVLSSLSEGDLLKVGPFEVKVHLDNWPAPETAAAHEAPDEPPPPMADQPTAHQPSAEQPLTHQPSAGQPTTDQPPPPAALEEFLPPPQQCEDAPHTPLPVPSDIGTLDTLRHKVSLLCEELLAYRDRLAFWERNLVAYSRDLEALAEKPGADAALGSTSTDRDALSDGGLEPVEALEKFSEALDRAQEVLGPIHKPEPSATDQATAEKPAAVTAEDKPGTEPQSVSPEPQTEHPNPGPEAGADAADESQADTAKGGDVSDAGDGQASAERKRARPASPKSNLKANEDGAQPTPRVLDPKYSLQAVINSMDLDPEVADQLRLLRRLNPGSKDGELLQRVLAEMQQTTTKTKKSSWWPLRRPR
ncbi:MAG: FHA domain-containing protein [Phycisphaerales bacterium]|nr:MAG: FHA domain-containing protein [Phycisphaerales bacterium]